MNLGDPELELIDPTPNVHSLFVHFDKVFFWTKLAGRALVRWSKRMYSCAGVCSYEGRGGVCDIALSEPLLKLRPRKDLIETLLHEMIHAYLFITCRDNDRDGHGPNFLAHMHRINKSAGLSISVYHSFHDEVKLYQTHWWRCNGPCQKMKPYFGIVRRSCNRPPGPSDYWFECHKRKCGGTFIKIKEPEKKTTKKPTKTKPNADITKYVNNNNDKTLTNKNLNNTMVTNKYVNNTINKINSVKGFPDLQNVKRNSSSTVVINKVVTPKVKSPSFVGSGKPVNNNQPVRSRSNTVDVAETVRNVWANKQLPTAANAIKPKIANINKSNETSVMKHKTDPNESPPRKIKKIDDYFKKTASDILKDVYGQNFKLVETENSDKLQAVTVKEDLVDCPICNNKVDNKTINNHIDECLNKDVIEVLTKENVDVIPIADDKSKLKAIVGNIPEIPAFKEIKTELDVKKEAIEKSLNVDTSSSIGAIVNAIDNKRRTVSPVYKVEDSDIIIKSEPGTSKDIENGSQICPCCGIKVDKPMREHLDECLVFFNNDTGPEEGSTSSAVIIIDDDDDDDEFDETLTFNATGTMCPCPCCLRMIENSEMNAHLDFCLS